MSTVSYGNNLSEYWRVRMVSRWQALYPILIVGIAPIALWVITGDANPTLPAIVQALAWMGFALLAMAVKSQTQGAQVKKSIHKELTSLSR